MDDNFTSTTPASNTTDGSYGLSNVDFSFAFQFWFSLSFHVPSVICYVFVFAYILMHKTQRQALPNFLMIFFSVTLLIRILWRKHLHRQNWKKCRKMAFQLLSICALYLSINLPLIIIALVQSIGYPEWSTQVQLYLLFFCGLIQYLLPFIYLTYLSGIWHNMETLSVRNRRRVAPIEAITLTQTQRQQMKM